MSSKESVKQMLGNLESNGDYNVMVGGKKVPLTGMTIGEVIKYQEGLKGNTAAGKYQIKVDTLKSMVYIPVDTNEDGSVEYAKDSDGNLKLRNPTDFNPNTKFDEAAQEWAADALLERRGWSDYQSGLITREDLATNLSKEWASMPDPAKGQRNSHYSGDGTHDRETKVSTDDVFKVLDVQQARSSRPTS